MKCLRLRLPGNPGRNSFVTGRMVEAREKWAGVGGTDLVGSGWTLVLAPSESGDLQGVPSRRGHWPGLWYKHNRVPLDAAMRTETGEQPGGGGSVGEGRQ